MKEEDSFENILRGLKFTNLSFPCGLKIEITKDILKDYKKLICPLHGKDCYNFRLVGEIGLLPKLKKYKKVEI